MAFDLDLRDNLQRTLFFTGRYEPALLEHLHSELRRGDVVLDVGAHIGVHALPIARRLRALGGGTMIAVEPTPDSASTLRRTAARNRLAVSVVEAAFGRARRGPDPRRPRVRRGGRGGALPVRLPG